MHGQAEETDAIMNFSENRDTAGPVMPKNPSLPFTDEGWSDLTWDPEHVTLDIPQNQAKLGTFESVVTWTLVDQAFK